MGWATDLHDASFRSVAFAVTSTSDSYSKALALHQAPYADDAYVEDMGTDPRKILIEAIFTGEDYKTDLDALEAALTQSGSGELIHPVYGVAQVQVVSWQVNHSVDAVDFASVSIEFVQAQAQSRQLFTMLSSSTIDTTLAITAPAAALETELKQLEKTDANGFYTRVATLSSGLRSAYQILSGTQKAIDDILSPATWAVDLVNDATRLVTFDVTDISALTKWRMLSDKIDQMADVFDGDSENNSETLETLWRAITNSSQTGVAQEVVSRCNAELAASPTDETTTILSPTELAVIRQSVRQDLQTAISSERELSSSLSVGQIQIYKQYADQIHQQIQSLIETRPPLTTTRLKSMSSLHLLAHQLYGDYQRSSEILRLNTSLENPAVLRVGQELIVYAR